MLLYIVRHGEPDYEKDVLTEEGKRQAEALADRFEKAPVDFVFSSPMGRARETAEPTARRLGLPVTVEPWMHELDGRADTFFPDGVRKTLSRVPPHLVADAAHAADPFAFPPYCEEGVAASFREIFDGLDAFTARLGWTRSGRGFYDKTGDAPRAAAMFCHCAMGRVCVSRLSGVPISYLSSTLFSSFTGVTVFRFGDEERDNVPRLLSYGDVGHLYAKGLLPVFQITYETY